MIMPDMLKNAPMFKRFNKKNRNQQIEGLGFAAGAAALNPEAAAAARAAAASNPSFRR